MNCEGRLTKKDVVVILGCMVLVLANLGAIGSTGRRRLKEAVCAANLKRLGRILIRYANDNDGYFMDRNDALDWPATLNAYYDDERLLLCPEAKKTYTEGARNPHRAWGPVYDDVVGSYVINLWISNYSNQIYSFWKTPFLSNASEGPMLLDGQWSNMQSFPEDIPSAHETDLWTPNQHEMQRACLNRHNGGVNCVFMDGSVRKVGLKSLWRLKWCPEWPDDDPLPVWPYWMENFKDP